MFISVKGSKKYPAGGGKKVNGDPLAGEKGNKRRSSRGREEIGKKEISQGGNKVKREIHQGVWI